MSGRKAKMRVAVQPTTARLICRSGRDCRILARVAGEPEVTLDVLHDDDAVIHEQAQCHDHSDDTELVDRKMEEVEQEEADQQRQGYGDHDHDRGPWSKRQERDHD